MRRELRQLPGEVRPLEAREHRADGIAARERRVGGQAAHQQEDRGRQRRRQPDPPGGPGEAAGPLRAGPREQADRREQQHLRPRERRQRQREPRRDALVPAPLVPPAQQALDPDDAERHGRHVRHAGRGHRGHRRRARQQQARHARLGGAQAHPQAEGDGGEHGGQQQQELHEVRGPLRTAEQGRGHQQVGHHRAADERRGEPDALPVRHDLEGRRVQRVVHAVLRLQQERDVVDGVRLAQERDQQREGEQRPGPERGPHPWPRPVRRGERVAPPCALRAGRRRSARGPVRGSNSLRHRIRRARLSRSRAPAHARARRPPAPARRAAPARGGPSRPCPG